MTRRECKGDSQGAVFYFLTGAGYRVHIEFVKIHQDVY